MAVICRMVAWESVLLAISREYTDTTSIGKVLEFFECRLPADHFTGDDDGVFSRIDHLNGIVDRICVSADTDRRRHVWY